MKASRESKSQAIDYLLSRGVSRFDAINRVSSVTPQRVHQLARLARGECSVCCKALEAGNHTEMCGDCGEKNRTRNREHQRKLRKAKVNP